MSDPRNIHEAIQKIKGLPPPHTIATEYRDVCEGDIMRDAILEILTKLDHEPQHPQYRFCDKCGKEIFGTDDLCNDCERR